RLYELRLSHGDRLDAWRSRIVDRHVGDARDDADARADEAAEIRDLAGHVEAHLDHRDLVTGLDPEKGERDSDLVVERRDRAQDAIAGAECRGGRLFGGRLADISG